VRGRFVERLEGSLSPSECSLRNRIPYPLDYHLGDPSYMNPYSGTTYKL